MSRRLGDPPMQIIVALAAGIPLFAYGEYMIATRVGLAYMALPIIGLWAYYELVWMNTPPADTEKYLEFKDTKLKKKWGKRKIPMVILFEAFLNDDVAFKKDCYETLINDREKF